MSYKRKTIGIDELKKALQVNKLKKQSMGLYNSIYDYRNSGNFRNRIYTSQDTEIGVNSLDRELLVRWSREVNSQTGFVNAAIRTLASYVVGEEYRPEYVGNNPEFGKVATQWLNEQFCPNCCTRGLNFNESMFLECTLTDIDGDLLCIYGKTSNGFPQFQLIPSHRITSRNTEGKIYEMNGMSVIDSDGVTYDKLTGRAVGYKVANTSNLVNSTLSSTQFSEKFVSSKDAHLIFERTKYIDKGRGIPSIAPAIIQALSLIEIESYQLQREKITSTIALIEKNQAGQAPIELEQTLAALQADSSIGLMPVNSQMHAVDLFQGNEIRYIKSNDGSDIKSMASTNPSNETQAFVQHLEMTVLSNIGVPAQLLFSPEKVSGRISDGIVGIFNSTIRRKQCMLDKHAKFIVTWALANAQEKGWVPYNDTENLYSSFEFSHPLPPSLNSGYDNASDLAAYSAGLISLGDISKKRKHTAQEVIEEREVEAMLFFESAQRISKKTGVDLSTVISSLREDLKGKPVTTAVTKAPFNE